MNDSMYNPNNPRVKKAKFALILDSSPLRMIFWLVILSSGLGFLYLLLIAKTPLSYLLLIPHGIFGVMLLWYYGELRNLPTVHNSNDVIDITNLIERHVLAKLKITTTPQELATILSKQRGGFFFASRFDISPQVLQAIVGNETSMDVIWKKSMDIMQITEQNEIDSAIIVAAIILSTPDPDKLLAPLQLDSEDILTGVKWFEHIQETIAIYKARKNHGGIGRDLSFGWAPTLNRIGNNITSSIESGMLVHRTVRSREGVIDQMMHVLSQPGKRNAAMVGESGVGKTTIVYSLAQKLIEQKQNVPKELLYHQVISLDASHLISIAPGRGQLEELIIHVLNEAIAAKNIIIFLDDAQLFLKDGTGSVDLTSILLPVLEGGALKIIISINDQEWLRLGQANSGLAQLLNRIVIKPLDETDTLQVMEDQVLLLEAQNKIVYMRQALQEAYKLSNRFIHEQAFPGKAIKLLEASAGFPEEKHFITAKSVQQAVEKTFDVKVQTADTSAERDTLLNLEERIHQRMINQSRAVKLVSDALRRARTGVRNENKPIGTFLFLGPTGVGKTELSKALASVYFGGEERLVRLDLNEFSHAEDTARLLASGAADQYSLCAQISKQPFSVVLLDEIEKAHPNVLNLLLQLLDEGTLRDTDNKPISFRDAVIIATSNAGADKIREHIQKGEQLEQFEEAFVNELIDSQIFRPEFLNRFDEIILFRPLTPEELLQVVDLLINQLNKRLASQKVTVSLSQSAKELMASTGYDPRLGARPLRRVMQRAVENVVAQKVLEGTVSPGQNIELDAPELQKVLDEH